MKPFGKAAMLAITLLMMALNGAMLIKLVERVQAHYAQPKAEAPEYNALNKSRGADWENLMLAAIGKTRPNNRPMDRINNAAKIFARCLMDAAHAHNIPPAAMIGILHVEGGRVGKESGPNADGSYDLGPMQINTGWLPELASAWRIDVRTARAVMRDDGCMNVKVAAWILHRNIKEAGSVYGGIARYHSSAPGRGKPYAAKVVTAIEQKGLRID